MVRFHLIPISFGIGVMKKYYEDDECLKYVDVDGTAKVIYKNLKQINCFRCTMPIQVSKKFTHSKAYCEACREDCNKIAQRKYKSKQGKKNRVLNKTQIEFFVKYFGKESKYR